MPHIHSYARHVTGSGRILYTCQDPACRHTVDFAAAREEFDRMGHDTTAGTIQTPHGYGRYVSYDGAREMVTVEMDREHLVEYPAADCYLPTRQQKGA